MTIRFFSPSLNQRMYDPMPLPGKRAKRRKMRINIAISSKPKKARPTNFGYSVKKIPLGR